MDVRLAIDNVRNVAEANRTFERRNPVSGVTVTTAAAASPADAIRAADAAARAFETWSLTGPIERRRILLVAANKLESRMESISQSMAAEAGASGLWGGFNVMAAAALIRKAAS